MWRLYQFPLCPFSRKVRLVLGEKAVAHELVRDAMSPTAQIAWPLLAERTGCEVWVKHENHTPIGAFKVRGGLIWMDARLGGDTRPRIVELLRT